MQICTQPSPASINNDPHFNDRFWYWYGASGDRYIHSVYPARSCPVMPRAVYLSVRRLCDDKFVPLSIEVADAVGLLTSTYVPCDGADEVHVHLLAEGDREARSICDDLKAGVFGRSVNKPAEPANVLADLQYNLLAGFDKQSMVAA